MNVELRPLGVKCNIQCQYCYQNPQRDAGNILQSYSLEKMMSSIERAGGPFSLFGGEALVVPEDDLEALFSWGLKKYGGNAIQTNGTLINERHIQLFKKYCVRVGVSVDGPGELNDVRWAGSLERTRAATASSHEAIERLCREGIIPGLIITLHRNNATADKLPIMHNWVRHLERLGVRSARLHILEVDHESVRDKYALTTQENREAMLSFAALEEELTTLKFDVFADMRNLLLGQDRDVTCVWGACDPYTTRAVQGVEGNGQTSNCGRTNKDGIDFTKSSVEGFERYLALYQTPQEHGGCQGCRFFLMCKGECPGTAIDGDWRNRTEQCEVWKGLYECLEGRMIADGLTPLSVSPLRPGVEQAFLQTWARGRNTTIARVLGEMSQAKQSAARSSHAAEGVERVAGKTQPTVGLVITAAGALPYVHLQLESRRRYYPRVPCLIHVDGGDQGMRIRALCEKYDVAFCSSERGLGKDRGELAGLIAGFDWARERRIDLLVKLSHPWLVLKDWTLELNQRALKFDRATYPVLCDEDDPDFPSRCAAYHVPTWFDDGAVEELRRYATIPSIGPEDEESRTSRLLRDLSRKAEGKVLGLMQGSDESVAGHPRSRGDGDGRPTGPSIHPPAAGVLWNGSAQPDAFWGVSQAWGLTEYEYKDFQVSYQY